jgi:hypothetical protein
MIQIQQFCIRGVVWIQFVLYLLKVFCFFWKTWVFTTGPDWKMWVPRAGKPSNLYSLNIHVSDLLQWLLMIQAAAQLACPLIQSWVRILDNSKMCPSDMVWKLWLEWLSKSCYDRALNVIYRFVLNNLIASIADTMFKLPKISVFLLILNRIITFKVCDNCKLLTSWVTISFSKKMKLVNLIYQ